MDIVNTKNVMGFFTILASLVLGGCGGGGDSQRGLIYDTSVTIPAATTNADTGATVNQYVSYDLGAGTYYAEITSTGGISIQWIPSSGTDPGSGSDCTEQLNMESYAGTCTLAIKGQLVLVNTHLLTEQKVTLKVIQR